jgi:hypothetical protein
MSISLSGEGHVYLDQCVAVVASRVIGRYHFMADLCR